MSNIHQSSKSPNANLRALLGHHSEETAYVIEDYPYGRLRTKKRVWVEWRKNFGFREMHQTQNPKNGRWNKPHAGQYSLLTFIYLQDLDLCGNAHPNFLTSGGCSSYNITPEGLDFLRMMPGMNLSEPANPNLKKKDGTLMSWGELLDIFEKIGQRNNPSAWKPKEQPELAIA